MPKTQAETAIQILLRYCEENWAQARQSEDQRATITNFILTIAAATIAFIAQKELSSEALPMSVFLILLGSFGCFMTYKYYERFKMHHKKVYYYTQERHWCINRRAGRIRQDFNWLGDFVRLRHTQMRHFVESGATN
jgi:uncharacterized membrane protein